MMQRRPPEPGVLKFGDLPVAGSAEPGVADLVAQLEDGVKQHLRARRAARQVDVVHDMSAAIRSPRDRSLWRLRLRRKRLPEHYLILALPAQVILIGVPYTEELLRCLRARRAVGRGRR